MIRSLVGLLCLLVAMTARAEYVIGLGGQFDSENSKAFSVFGSFSVSAKSWLSATAMQSNSEGLLFDLDTVYFDAGFDHHFDPVGLRIGAGYWGDPDLLDSNDIRAAIYWRNDRASLSLDVERRAFDFTLQSLFNDTRRRVEFDADGIGASLRFDLSDTVSAYANGMTYDYSRNIAIQPNVDALRIFALSSLSAVNSLLDKRVSGGLEVSVGARTVDVRLSSWESAVFGDRVISVGAGLLTPLGDSGDIEFRLATDDSDASGRATVFSVFLFFYGK